jgi:aryl-alcohol dehydrogenase-like predicted oxidoreductase
MDYRYLGRCGFRVPALSLGTATFGGKGDFFAAWGDTGTEQTTRLVDRCLHFGLNMFDSADIYSAGLAEEILGAAIKGKRDRVIISTKATFRFGDGPNDVGSSRFHLINACEKALKRLGTDYIDIFQLHARAKRDTRSPISCRVRRRPSKIVAVPRELTCKARRSPWVIFIALTSRL